MAFFEFPNTRTYDSDLGWLIRNVKALLDNVESLDGWKETFEAQYNELKIFYQNLVSGNFPDDFESGLTIWMQNNAYDIIGELIKILFFGLTDDGYFVAYIPDSWDDIIFNTSGYDISIADIDFGHLILSY